MRNARGRLWIPERLARDGLSRRKRNVIIERDCSARLGLLRLLELLSRLDLLSLNPASFFRTLLARFDSCLKKLQRAQSGGCKEVLEGGRNPRRRTSWRKARMGESQGRPIVPPVVRSRYYRAIISSSSACGIGESREQEMGRNPSVAPASQASPALRCRPCSSQLLC